MKLILSSNSPRRRELLAGLDIPFEIRVVEGIDESFPDDLPTDEIASFVSQKKASAYVAGEDEIVITADTIVVIDGRVLGKPRDIADAAAMLRTLSGRTHRVITGVTLKSHIKETTFSVVSEVTFKSLSEAEISYYLEHYKPLDKAGAYGIQEWIGYVGVTSLSGSYFNVMGFPIQRIYEVLCKDFGLRTTSFSTDFE
ncbi:MAG: septum formation protein Maf [Muribaculaceae bacterium]|nr:septum formation protein Maf [Muribaculaceae bacterium]